MPAGACHTLDILKSSGIKPQASQGHAPSAGNPVGDKAVSGCTLGSGCHQTLGEGGRGEGQGAAVQSARSEGQLHSQGCGSTCLFPTSKKALNPLMLWEARDQHWAVWSKAGAAGNRSVG